MGHVRRRFLTIPGVFVAVPLWFVLGPIVLPALVFVDVVTGRFRLPSLRLWIYGLIFCLHEWVGIAYALWLWLVGGFGRRLDYEASVRMQRWWAASLLEWARRLLDVVIDLDEAPIPPGRVIVLSRHASMVDAVIPAHLFTARLRRPVHYVLKRELQFLPNLDIYGHRLGNHFVTRGGDTEAEVARIARLADEARPDAGLVIFPEGTYATPASKARIGASLRRRGEVAAADLNDELRFLLPPKPAGTLALLDHRPDAAIVILAHTGLEGVAELRGLRRGLPLRGPVVVRWWEVDRETLPVDPDDRVAWLNDRWRELDDWVARHRR